ncbi:UPF0280 family protein [Aquabacter cavernae]|uniref:UPF0280 family protein n=1 Tax=Aquabacter cavernae TaxID=2496029 RepID=UPI000F8CE480|nr:UPF0280 family protein [Aquabacter cavernae]
MPGALPTSPLPRHAPQAALLADGRLHLQDGPIDLIIEANGTAEAVHAAYAAAAERFAGLLDELCDELPALRAPAAPDASPLRGPVARRMWAAVRPFAAEHFITPMAAVAGAVAQEILAAMVRPGLARAYVNNGGDIALHLSQGESFRIGLVDRPDQPSLTGTAVVDHDSPARGIATSGWRGRSFSLGIADAVTILAPDAAMADAAATIVANAVDLPGRRDIVRVPAESLQPDNDLGARRVTRAVPLLAPEERAQALDTGLACAHHLVRRGLICAAALHLQGETVAIGPGLLQSFPATRRAASPEAPQHRLPQHQQGRTHA